jgi:hypothetical protein
MKSTFNFEKFKRFRKDLTILLNNPNPGPPFDRCFKLWGMMYLAEMKKLFVTYSRGGGNWKGLAKSTLAVRRRMGSHKTTILWNKLGSIMKALSVGAPGNRFEKITGGIRVGFGGSAKYPDEGYAGHARGDTGKSRYGHKGKATIRDIAVFHQTGAGHLPQREILHEPSAGLRSRMMQQLKIAVNKLMS